MGARSTKNTTQNNRSDGHLLEYFRNTFIRGGGGTNLFSATGGTITTADGKTIHTFTSSGTFEVTDGSANVEYIIIAGGGSGGNQITPGGYAGGGGGAGGFLTGSLPVSAQSYPIIVGSGAVAGPGPTRNSGNPSVGFGITSIGGGAGGYGSAGPGLPGGSGGGGGAGLGGPGSGTPGQGFPGGDSSFVPFGSGGSAAGGGGAGGGGANGITDGATTRTAGGIGVTSPWSVLPGVVCSGGPGGSEDNNIGDDSLNATVYGGGGGGNSGVTPGSGGSGYPGIVIIRY